MRTDCPDCIWVTSHGGMVIHRYEPCDVCRKSTLHDTIVDIKGERWKWPEYPPFCHRCGKDMRAKAVHTDRIDWPHDSGDEPQNEATILFRGGYGSFIDDLGDVPSVRLCHECGHELCDWIGIDPRHWHTHSVYGGQHEDHHDKPASG